MPPRSPSEPLRPGFACVHASRTRRQGICALALVITTGWTAACESPNGATRLTLSASAVGPEAVVVRRQVDRFEQGHPGVAVDLRITPDAADQRHQLYVQWLNAHAPEPDVLQLDVIWTAEFAGAGWILPLDESSA